LVYNFRKINIQTIEAAVKNKMGRFPNVYTVELRLLELEGTVKICSSYRTFEPPRSRNLREK